MSGQDEKPLKVVEMEQKRIKNERQRNRQCLECGDTEFYRYFTDDGIVTKDTQDGYDCDYNHNNLEWEGSWKCTNCNICPDEELIEWLNEQN